MPARWILALIGALPALGGCEGGPRTDGAEPTDAAAAERDLVDHTVWTLVEAAADPFADHRPDDARCPVGAFHEDGGGVEVETGTCTWGALTQPSLVEVLAGDTVRLFVFHTELVSADPDAEGHVAVQLGDQLLWEETVPIPAEATPYDVEVPADVDAPAGTPVHLHVHNHGSNAWKLLDLVVRPGG